MNVSSSSSTSSTGAASALQLMDCLYSPFKIVADEELVFLVAEDVDEVVVVVVLLVLKGFESLARGC